MALGFRGFVSIVEISNVKNYPGFENLDGGEIEAICLAMERCLPLLIEEEQGRRIAASLGLRVSGIAGQILKASRERLISATVAQAHLADLLKAGRIGKRLYGGLIEALN